MCNIKQVLWLKEKCACDDVKNWFEQKYGDKSFGAVTVIKTLMSEHQHRWANWTITRVMTHPQQIQYAIFAAEQVLKIYEDQYPDNNCPRAAINAAKSYLANPNSRTKAATDAAANAAYAAYVAINAATSAATNAALLSKILNYGLSLLEAQCQTG